MSNGPLDGTDPVQLRSTDGSIVIEGCGSIDLRTAGGGGGPGGAGAYVARASTVGNDTRAGLAPRDGVAIVADDIILVAEQALEDQNGLFRAAAGPWPRYELADTSEELVGALVRVMEGTLHGGSWWAEQSPAPLAVGVSPQHWFRIDEYVDPRWFGARADGITDDYVAFKAAVGAAVTTGKPLYVADGTTLIRIPFSAGVYQTINILDDLSIWGDGIEQSRVLFTTPDGLPVVAGAFIGLQLVGTGKVIRVNRLTWECAVGGGFSTVGFYNLGDVPGGLASATIPEDCEIRGWGNALKQDDNFRTNSGRIQATAMKFRGGFSGTLGSGSPTIVLDQGYDPYAAIMSYDDCDFYNDWILDSNGAHCIYSPAGTSFMGVRCRFWKARVYGVTAFSGTGDGVARFETFAACYFDSALGAAYSSDNGTRALFSVCTMQGCGISADGIPQAGISVIGGSATGQGTAFLEEVGADQFIDIVGSRFARQLSGSNLIRNVASLVGSLWGIGSSRFEGGDPSTPRIRLQGGTTRISSTIFVKAVFDADGVLLSKAQPAVDTTYAENLGTVDGVLRDRSLASYVFMQTAGGGNYPTTVSSPLTGLNPNGVEVTAYARPSIAAGPEKVYYRTNPDGTGAIVLLQSTREVTVRGVAAPAGSLTIGVEGIEPASNITVENSAVLEYDSCDNENSDVGIVLSGTAVGYLRNSNWGPVVTTWLWCRADANGVRLHGGGNQYPLHPSTGGGLAPVMAGAATIALGDLETGQGTYGSAAAPIASAVATALSTNHNVTHLGGAAAIDRLFFPNSGFTGTRFFVGTRQTIIPAAGSAFTTVAAAGGDGQFVFVTSAIARPVGVPITFVLVDPGGGGPVGWYEV